MDTALRLLLTNAATAAVVAAVALVASRFVRRPALAHALWLLALVKLVTPPLVPLPLLPAWDFVPTLSAARSPTFVRMASDTHALPGAGTAAAARVAHVRPSGAAPFLAETGTAVEAARTARAEPGRLPAAWPLRLLAAWVLGIGAVGVLSLAALRFVRFRRMLAYGEPAPAALEARAARIAAELGLRRVPPVLVVAARIPPMLWPEPSGPLLLLPRDLLRELSVPECDALLAHELAHVQRRDHWVRLVELAATALFWWYPLTWWARAALRRAEERCCDEWVLRLLPRSAEAYAQGLLKSLSFVSSAPASVPALASGASPLYELELRLKEILMSRPAPRLARPLRLALLATAAVGLAVFPTHARDEPARRRPPPRCRLRRRLQDPVLAPSRVVAPSRVTAPALATAPRAAQAPSPVTGPAPAEDPSPAARSEDPARRALEDQRRSLDAKRRVLQQQELELQRQEIDLNERAEQAELRATALRMRAEGNAREAEGYEKRLAMTSRQTDLQRRQLALEAEQMQLQAKQEAAELAQRDQLEALEAAGNESGIAAAQRARERADADRQKLEQALETKHRAIEAEMEAMQKQMQVLDAEEQIHAMSEATEDMARALAEQVEALRAALQQTGTRPEVEREIKRIEAALDGAQAELAPADGRQDAPPQPAALTASPPARDEPLLAGALGGSPHSRYDQGPPQEGRLLAP